MVELSPIQEAPAFRACLRSPELAPMFRAMEPEWLYTDETLLHFAKEYVWINDESGKHLGLASVTNMNDRNKKAEVGVAVFKDSGDRGAIAKEAITKVGEFLFQSRGYERIECKILSSAKHIARLLESNGFRQEAELRNSIYWNGEFHNEQIWAILKEDYYGS